MSKENKKKPCPRCGSLSWETVGANRGYCLVCGANWNLTTREIKDSERG